MKARIINVSTREELEDYVRNCKEREAMTAEETEQYIAEKIRERDAFFEELRRQEAAEQRHACIPPRGYVKYYG